MARSRSGTRVAALEHNAVPGLLSFLARPGRTEGRWEHWLFRPQQATVCKRGTRIEESTKKQFDNNQKTTKDQRHEIPLTHIPSPPSAFLLRGLFISTPHLQVLSQLLKSSQASHDLPRAKDIHWKRTMTRDVQERHESNSLSVKSKDQDSILTPFAHARNFGNIQQ